MVSTLPIFDALTRESFGLIQRAENRVRRKHPIKNLRRAIQPDRLRLAQREQAGDVIKFARRKAEPLRSAIRLTLPFGCKSGNENICVRRSGLALSSDHREPSALTATEHCVRAFARIDPSAARRNLRSCSSTAGTRRRQRNQGYGPARRPGLRIPGWFPTRCRDSSAASALAWDRRRAQSCSS